MGILPTPPVVVKIWQSEYSSILIYVVLEGNLRVLCGYPDP